LSRSSYCARLAVAQVQRGDVGAGLLDRGLEDGVEDVVEIERGRERLADLVDRQRLAQADVLGLQLLAVQPALDDVDDLLDLERLEDVVVGAALHRLDRGLDRAEPGHDHGQDRSGPPRRSSRAAAAPTAGAS
jgi:hypothetical protein